MDDLRWSSTWEDDVADEEHLGYAEFLRRCYPDSRAGFGGTRSWSNARPELRLVGHDGDRPVAHLGILRRFLQVAEASIPVGDVGLVAVDPDRRGRGTGAALLDRAAAVLHDFALPFGFLTCGQQVVPFYEACGWTRVANPTRMIRADGRVQVYGGAAMVLPVRAAAATWPAAGTVDRNGPEI